MSWYKLCPPPEDAPVCRVLIPRALSMYSVQVCALLLPPSRRHTGRPIRSNAPSWLRRPRPLCYVVAVTVAALSLPLLSMLVTVPLAVAEPSYPAPMAVVCRWRTTAWLWLSPPILLLRLWSAGGAPLHGLQGCRLCGEESAETQLESTQACMLSH
jgi:hypothetical protein